MPPRLDCNSIWSSRQCPEAPPSPTAPSQHKSRQVALFKRSLSLHCWHIYAFLLVAYRVWRAFFHFTQLCCFLSTRLASVDFVCPPNVKADWIGSRCTWDVLLLPGWCSQRGWCPLREENSRSFSTLPFQRPRFCCSLELPGGISFLTSPTCKSTAIDSERFWSHWVLLLMLCWGLIFATMA